MKCDSRMMIKMAVGLGVALAAAYFVLPAADAFILAIAPVLVVLICPVAMLLMMWDMRGGKKPEKAPADESRAGSGSRDADPDRA